MLNANHVFLGNMYVFMNLGHLRLFSKIMLKSKTVTNLESA